MPYDSTLRDDRACFTGPRKAQEGNVFFARARARVDGEKNACEAIQRRRICRENEERDVLRPFVARYHIGGFMRQMELYMFGYLDTR